MLNPTMLKSGEERSAIRALYEYGKTRAEEIGAENVFDFSLGSPSAPPPACVREEIERLLEKVPAQELHGYTSAAGIPAVRGAVAEYLREALDVPASADLIYMTCGAAAALTVTLNALCEAGDEFVVVTPCFPEYRVFIRSAGGKVVEAKTDERFHLDIAALDCAIGTRTKAVIINSPNNPTGAVYCEEELSALARLLEKKSEEKGEPVFLISDEPYRELSYEKSVPLPAKAYANTVICYSFSKSLSLAGERIGYIAVSPSAKCARELFSAVCGAGRSLGYVCAPALFQRVCAACLWTEADTRTYEQNRDLLYENLVKFGYGCAKPDGAFYLFVKSPEADAKAFCERAKKYELLLVPSDSFGIGGYARISYCVPRERIERALPAFRALIEEYRG